MTISSARAISQRGRDRAAMVLMLLGAFGTLLLSQTPSARRQSQTLRLWWWKRARRDTGKRFASPACDSCRTPYNTTPPAGKRGSRSSGYRSSPVGSPPGRRVRR